MKNLNATFLFCSNIREDDGGTKSLIGLFNNIMPIMEKNNKYYLNDFNIILNSCVIWNKNDNDNEKDDYIRRNKSYEFVIWLTHVESGNGIPLYKFDLSFDEGKIRTWCKNIYEFKKFLTFPSIELPKGLGNYAIKLFVREKNETNWNLHTIHSLVVGGSM